MKALRRALEDTQAHGRVEAIASSPSAGVHLKHRLTLDLGSPSTTDAAMGMVEPASISYLQQYPKLPPHPQKKRPTYLSPF